MITDLIQATEASMRTLGIAAPLMLVRGDGSLVSAQFARNRPIETILSGPAASLIGAAHLTGMADAVVSDIGGTTTDIAILRDGRPALSPDGARVGGHHTMVEAVAMTTHGLGGDSEIEVDETSLTPRLRLGPRRHIPVSLLATQHPEIVHKSLDEQLSQSVPGAYDTHFVMLNPAAHNRSGLRASDITLLDALSTKPHPMASVLKTRMQLASLRRLTARGLVRIAGFTPSDAAHVLDLQRSWDRNAALKAAMLMARKRDAGGRPVAASPAEISELVHASLVRLSAEYLLDAALAHDNFSGHGHSTSPLAKAALDGHTGAARVSIGLNMPLVGLGASAGLHYPVISQILGTISHVPEDADVANAVGAVVGRVRITQEVLVTQPTEGRFTIHLADGVEHLATADAARARALSALREHTRDAARIAGASEIELSEDWVEKTAAVEGRAMFIEGRASVTASGRPKLA